MDTKRLKSFMALKGDTNEILANAIGISPQRLSMKINEKDGAEFTQNEISKIKDRYKLTAEDIDATFFN